MGNSGGQAKSIRKGDELRAATDDAFQGRKIPKSPILLENKRGAERVR